MFGETRVSLANLGVLGWVHSEAEGTLGPGETNHPVTVAGEEGRLVRWLNVLEMAVCVGVGMFVTCVSAKGAFYYPPVLTLPEEISGPQVAVGGEREEREG